MRPRTTGTHTCFAAGCTVQVDAKFLMCPSHWRRVPKKVAAIIWATVGDNTQRSAYNQAVLDAMLAVADKEGKPEQDVYAHLHQLTVDGYAQGRIMRADDEGAPPCES